eukprot:TRINITY_DN619_c0_g1_i1.p2 TRINITY_DN619_c0_g1~~TRINITY_DN619_c0_g1_i1.p2  ORF type:complete len:115 (-),score=52.83 TRINITY_DN619_c0_g1_i1:414-758(-)
MRYIAAFLLAVLGGNANPDKAAIMKILDSVGIKAEEERVTKLLDEMKGKNIADVIKAGQEKMCAAGPVASAPAAEAKEEKKGDDKKGKKEEKKKEEAAPEPEAEDVGGVSGLFD